MINREFLNKTGRASILNVALDVHMTAVGSYDRSTGMQANDVAFLEQRLAAWEPSYKAVALFDTACMAVIKEAVHEANRGKPRIAKSCWCPNEYWQDTRDDICCACGGNVGA